MSYVLKYKRDIFFLFSIQNIKSSCYIIFLKFFPIIFYLWKIYSFPVICIYKSYNFCYSLCIFFLFLHNLTQLLQRIENICYLFFWWHLLLLFCFLSYYVWCLLNMVQFYQDIFQLIVFYFCCRYFYIQ